jgi:hypothetical protein
MQSGERPTDRGDPASRRCPRRPTAHARRNATNHEAWSRASRPRSAGPRASLSPASRRSPRRRRPARAGCMRSSTMATGWSSAVRGSASARRANSQCITPRNLPPLRASLAIGRFSRPTQSHEIARPDGGPIRTTDQTEDELRAEILDEVRALGLMPPETAGKRPR